MLAMIEGLEAQEQYAGLNYCPYLAGLRATHGWASSTPSFCALLKAITRNLRVFGWICGRVASLIL